MDELSPKSRLLIDRVRPGFQSAPADRTRVRALITSGTSASVSAMQSGGVVPSVARRGLIGALAIGALGVAAVIVFSGRSTQMEHAREKTLHERVAAEPATSTESERHSPERSELVEAPPTVARTPRTSAPQRLRESSIATLAAPDATSLPAEDSLARELRLVRGARAAIRAHDSQLASSLLRQHETEFPSGMLVEERQVARALLRCDNSRAEGEGAEVAAAFAQRFPLSPSNATVRAACVVPRTSH